MARKVITVLTDDLDGGKADRTVEFSLDGVSYAIDLSDENIGTLRKALDDYISAGRRIGRGGVDARRSAQWSASPATSRATDRARTGRSVNGPPRTATRSPNGDASRRRFWRHIAIADKGARLAGPTGPVPAFRQVR